MAPREVTLTVPLNITVRLGDGSPGATRFEQLTSELAEEAARPRSYYQGYRGYDHTFLNIPVPVPPLTEEQRRNAAKTVMRRRSSPTVLPYTHFSVVMNRRRPRLLHRRQYRWQSEYRTVARRGSLVFDSRIAESEQIGEALYRRNALDRGHLVRRLDPVWGPQGSRANDDTFHFTNCSPQHERFNQGQDRWQGIENYILNNADARNRKVTVFTGPVMDEDNPIYKGIRLPLAFWKIIAYVKADGTLATAAYVLEQGKLIRDMLRFEAAFDPGAYRVELAHLKERTGLDFDYLKEAELPLSSDGLKAARDRVRIREDYRNLSL